MFARQKNDESLIKSNPEIQNGYRREEEARKAEINFKRSEREKREYFTYAEWFFLICIIAGFFFAILTPPMQAPDEIVHFYKSYTLSQFQLIPEVDEDGNVVNDLEDDVMIFANSFSNLQFNSDAKVDMEVFTSWINTAFSSNDDTTQVSYVTANSYMIYYIPQMLGMMFAEVLGLGIYWILIFGRLANLLAYATMLYFAIRITPVGKNMFFLLGMMPMAVFLAASVSYDVMVIGVTALLTANLFKLIYDPRVVLTTPRFIAIFVFSSLLLFLKTVYYPLILLFLAIPREKFEGVSDRTKNFVHLVIGNVSIFLIIFVARKILFVGIAGSDTLTMEQIQYVMSDPQIFLDVLKNTFNTFGDAFKEGFIGNLGWLDTPLPPWLISIYYLFLGMALFIPAHTEKKMINYKETKGHFGVAFLEFLAIIGFIFLLFGTFYFIYTASVMQTIGTDTILGVQGRYFIPISFSIAVVLKMVIGKYLPNFEDYHYLFKKINIMFVCLALVTSLIIVFTRYYVA